MAVSTSVRFSGGPTPPKSPSEDSNPGRAIVAHVVQHLPRFGVVIIGTADLEYAHEIRCLVAGKPYSVMVSYDWLTPGWWEVFYAPRLSLVKRLLGATEDTEMRALTQALAGALDSLPGIGETRWYREYGVSASRGFSLRPEV